MHDSSPGRFVLWIDGVGGYLVCPGEAVTLGQAVGDASVDVPLLGDLSRRHARIRRDASGYVLESWRPCRIDDKPVGVLAPLTDGALLELGEGVRLRFRLPHPLSRSARLEFVSQHRTQPAVDAVVLAAEACVLGPAAQCHIVCPRQRSEVVLFRQVGGWACRAPGAILIDGVTCDGGGPVRANSRVVGSDFSLSFEPLGGQ